MSATREIWKAVPSSWLQLEGRRLDGRPYLSGALEAKVRLEKLSVRKDSLANVTRGVVNAGRIKRVWVEDPAYGTPFLSSTDILQADLSNLRLIANSAIRANSRLVIQQGWTLITRAGSIGRMAYARPDMDGMACTEDVLRVLPDPDKVPPGYLYAYLRSKFGVPLVVSGTYGAIIQHIEPRHIADLPVPRLGDDVERRAHDLAEAAAALRTKASRLLRSLVAELEQIAGLPTLPPTRSPMPYGCSAVAARDVLARLDAFFHSSYRADPLSRLRSSALPTATVSELATSIVEPLRFKRTKVDDPALGVPFFGTAALMRSEPASLYRIPKRQFGISQYIVDRRCLLVPRSGQLSGIIGTVVMPYGDVVGGAVSEDAIRIHCSDLCGAGFLCIALTSEYGRRQLKARAYGTSIPHLDVFQVGQVLVPDPGTRERLRLGRAGARVAELRDESVRLEREARALVERAIEEAT